LNPNFPFINPTIAPRSGACLKIRANLANNLTKIMKGHLNRGANLKVVARGSSIIRGIGHIARGAGMATREVATPWLGVGCPSASKVTTAILRPWLVGTTCLPVLIGEAPGVTNLVVTAAVIAMTGMNAKATGKIVTNQKGACLPSPWEQVRAPG
jgi:hypothetical protein